MDKITWGRLFDVVMQMPKDPYLLGQVALPVFAREIIRTKVLLWCTLSTYVLK